jgi:hypothetical protein
MILVEIVNVEVVLAGKFPTGDRPLKIEIGLTGVI